MNKKSNAHIIVAGILSLFVGVGVGRFSFTSLLPFMLEEGALSLTFSGVLASSNYVGYLSGSIFSVFLKSLESKVKYLRLGLVLCMLTTIIMGVSTNSTLWLLGRVVAGFGAAMALVVGGAVVMMKLNLESKTKAMGVYFSGIGVSLVLSDIISRYSLVFTNWQGSWVLLSVSAVLVMWYPMIILSVDKNNLSHHEQHRVSRNNFPFYIIVLIMAYFTAGIGFVIQGTFLPTILKSLPGLEQFAGMTWLLVGVAAIPSTIIWMRLAHRFGSVNMMMIAITIQTIGILIPTLTDNIILIVLCGPIYGGTFSGLVALFMNLGGKLAGKNPVILMGAMTTAYGVGQVTGPLYAVTLTGWSGSYDYSLYLTAAIVFSGALMLWSVRNKVGE